MTQVNILEAKTELSKLIKMLEMKQEECILIARSGKPIVQLTLVKEVPASSKIGIAKKEELYSDDYDFDQYNDEIAKMFGVME